MRNGDIRSGVVYGVAPRWREDPHPAVFLQDTPRAVFFQGRNGLKLDPQPGSRPWVGSATGDGARGYAAVTGPADALAALDCRAELDRLLGGLEPSRPGLRWTLVTQLSKVIGPYPEALSAYQARQSSMTAEADARCAQVDAAVSALAALGIEVTPGYYNATVTIPAAQASALAARTARPAPGPPAGAEGLSFPGGAAPAAQPGARRQARQTPRHSRDASSRGA